MRSTITMSLAMWLALGCDNSPVVPPDTGPEDDAGPAGDAGVDAGRRDAGPTSDGNDSFANAETIVLGATATTGAISPARDLDYYTFEGTAGQWIQIQTGANPNDDPTMVDTAITLYDASMTQIADNDDSVPRTNTDSEIITRLPATGTYYVLVQEFSTWAGETPEGMPSFMYALAIAEVNPTASGINIDAEAGDDVASAQPLRELTAVGNTFSLILGDFDDATDVDVYSLTIPAGDPRNYSVYMMPIGNEGYGATDEPARLWITNEDGTEVIARVDPSVIADLQPSLTPDTDGTTFLLFVEHGTAVGDFYVLKAFRSADNRAEVADTTNNDPLTPEPLAFSAPEDGVRTAFVLAHLGDGDVDHFSLVTMTGEAVSVFCASATGGSGVMALTATLLQSDGTTVVATSIEGATTGVEIENRAVPTPGTYLLQITKTGQSPEVTGDWVRCGVLLAPPPAP